MGHPPDSLRCRSQERRHREENEDLLIRRAGRTAAFKRPSRGPAPGRRAARSSRGSKRGRPRAGRWARR
eukprot:13883175-Alexandrium_andersonii.AAC.1